MNISQKDAISIKNDYLPKGYGAQKLSRCRNVNNKIKGCY